MAPSSASEAAPGEGRATLTVVADTLRKGIAAKKCHSCGCFHAAVAAFEKTEAGRAALAGALERARAVLVDESYDCLGCAVCFPAIAQNAFADAFPGEAVAPLCPTEVPRERSGWPPLPGDYKVLRFGAPVAVCTLNSRELSEKLAAAAPPGLALTGTLHTENLGIERIIRNVLANPNLRFLVLCGEDTRQAIGHLPGQSLAALCTHGLDESGRIRGARGKRPVLKNVTGEQVEAFRRQTELVALIGELDLGRAVAAVNSCAERNAGPFEGVPIEEAIPIVTAREPSRLVLDPSGFLVIYSDEVRGIVLEHYRNEGVLDCVIAGPTPSSVGATAIERGLVSRLDHAVYLGRELARAEESLRTGSPYVQDRAPGSTPGAAATEPQNGENCGCAGKS